MSKKILVSGITLEDANVTPLLLKARKWQELGSEVTFFGAHSLKEKIDGLNIIDRYKFIELKGAKKSKSKIGFIFESIKRNILGLFYIAEFKKKYDVVYSISSVLDIIIFPYCLSMLDRGIRWCVVFDNTVPLFQGGNKIIRFLAWIFFNISLFFLRKASAIFAISDELKDFLLKMGFKNNNIIITGNAIEVDMIKKAQKKEDYNIDILFVGRVDAAKGIYDMLKVLDILKKEYSNIQLAIMGSGNELDENKFKMRIVELGLEENINFLGFKTGVEKFNIIKSSKSFLFLSSNESFGVALLEAVCCGVSAFAYDLPVYKKIYKKEEIYVSEKGDFESTAMKMIEFFKNNDFENRMGKLLVNHYTWDKIAQIEFNTF